MHLTRLFAAALAGLAAMMGGAELSYAQPVSPPGGQLRCDVEGGVSFFVGSSRRLDCVFIADRQPAGILQRLRSTASVSISASNPRA